MENPDITLEQIQECAKELQKACEDPEFFKEISILNAKTSPWLKVLKEGTFKQGVSK